MFYTGIDAGSRSVKILIFDSNKSRIIGSGLTGQGVEQKKIVTKLFHDLLITNGIREKDISRHCCDGIWQGFIMRLPYG
ncbi:MAG: hypothetical protein JW774_04565 [Candidatus Aureabacteria bacterium]|nr:hypothetical protein [Candidatus Auribacterota bacterium]